MLPTQTQAAPCAQTSPEAGYSGEVLAGCPPMSLSSEFEEEGECTTSVIPAFYRIRDVQRLTALTRATLYRRIAAGRFPPPVHLGGRVCAWPRTALQAWIADPEHYRAPPEYPCEFRRPRGRPRKYDAA